MGRLAKVEGTVTVLTDAKTQMIKFYECEFILGDDIKTVGEARAIIQNGLIVDKLKREFDGFKRVRECQVISLEDTKDESESPEYEKLLMEATNLQCIPNTLGSYEGTEQKIKLLKASIKKARDRIEADKKKKKAQLGQSEG